MCVDTSYVLLATTVCAVCEMAEEEPSAPRSKMKENNVSCGAMSSSSCARKRWLLVLKYFEHNKRNKIEALRVQQYRPADKNPVIGLSLTHLFFRGRETALS